MNYLDNIIDGDNYKLKFDFCFCKCDNFKERELLMLRNIISRARIGDDMVFYKYANIVFDDTDKKHEHPIVTELNQFGRGKTNAIIFNLNNTTKNPAVYDKCIIYQTIYKNDSFYGYVMFNTQTKRYSHIYNITYDITNLLVRMWQSIDILQREDMYNYYLTRNVKLAQNDVA